MLSELIEPYKLVSNRRRVSGEFDSMKESHPTNLKWRLPILVELCLRELCDSKLSGLLTLDNSHFTKLKRGQNQKGRL